MGSIRFTSFLLAFRLHAGTRRLPAYREQDHAAQPRGWQPGTVRQRSGRPYRCHCPSAACERAGAIGEQLGPICCGQRIGWIGPASRDHTGGCTRTASPGCSSHSSQSVHSAQSKCSDQDRGRRPPWRESAAPSDHSRWHVGRDSSDGIAGLRPQCKRPELCSYLGGSHRGG